jgi:hypothetical protein
MLQSWAEWAGFVRGGASWLVVALFAKPTPRLFALVKVVLVIIVRRFAGPVNCSDRPSRAPDVIRAGWLVRWVGTNVVAE